MTIADFKLNLSILLTNDYEDISNIPDMPTEDDILKALGQDILPDDVLENLDQTTAGTNGDDEPNPINEPCIVIWDDKNGKRNWYLGICIKKTKEKNYVIEHLERTSKGSENKHLRWQYPNKSDIQEVCPKQLLPCNIIGLWELG